MQFKSVRSEKRKGPELDLLYGEGSLEQQMRYGRSAEDNELITRIRTLENSIKKSKKSLEKLDSENKLLRTENQGMREVNSNLCKALSNFEEGEQLIKELSKPSLQETSAISVKRESKAVGELHSLYENLFLHDLHEQRERTMGEIGSFTTKTQSAQKDITHLKKENTHLQNTIKRYRKIVDDFVQNKGDKKADLLSDKKKGPNITDDFPDHMSNSTFEDGRKKQVRAPASFA